MNFKEFIKLLFNFEQPEPERVLRNSFHITWDKIKYFKAKEFDSPDMPGTGDAMDLSFVAKLDRLRHLCGFPLVILSGYRTTEHNTVVGGTSDSSHLMGKAVDVLADESWKYDSIVKFSYEVGLKRRGFNNNSVHLDDDRSKPQNVAWTYYK